MEEQISSRFDAKVLQSLHIPGLKVESLDCRKSSCRLEVSWGLEDLLAAHNAPNGKGADPLVLLGRSLGPLAFLQNRLRPRPGDLVVPGEWNVVRRMDGRFYTISILLFGDSDIDPDTYRTAVASYGRATLPIGTPIVRTGQ
jgi:hypothetical protein